MGANAVLLDKHASGWTDGAGEGGDLASSRFPGRDQPTLSRPVDRLDPADYTGRAGAGIRISLD